MNQCEQILAYMQEHGSITQLEAFQEFGVMRLASRINDLKRQGYKITRKSEKTLNRYNKTVLFTRYSLV